MPTQELPCGVQMASWKMYFSTRVLPALTTFGQLKQLRAHGERYRRVLDEYRRYYGLPLVLRRPSAFGWLHNRPVSRQEMDARSARLAAIYTSKAELRARGDAQALMFLRPVKVGCETEGTPATHAVNFVWNCADGNGTVAQFPFRPPPMHRVSPCGQGSVHPLPDYVIPRDLRERRREGVLSDIYTCA